MKVVINFFFLELKLNINGTPSIYMGFFAKKIHMSLLQDRFGHMAIPGPFQRQLKNNYLIFKPNYFITTFISY